MPTCSLHRQVDNMAELMAHADLAMGAGGSTVWERCCLGLPALMLSVAANQEEIAKACADAGAGLYLGGAADISAERLAQALDGLRARDLDEMGRRAATLVDGLGAGRVADVMKELRMGG
ncbi:undecaprenyldiphospho-muramoylpentapeptide beta-N- acetylglucosaminyltransferase [compost metagenome]